MVSRMAPSHSAAGRPAPRMSTAAQARVLSVEDVMALAAEGRLRIPNFQRGFNWDLADRRDLLDSIYRGYPVGTLLLWKNPPERTEAGRPLGAVESPEHGDIFFVVDGQQRLTTLWEALGRAPAPTETALLFDIEEGTVISRRLTSDEIEGLPPPSADRLPPVPLHLVLDAAILSGWVPGWMPIDQRRRYYELGKRIREHKLGLYIVEHADIDALRHVFDRVNTTGRSMGRDDVFDALIGSKITRNESAGSSTRGSRT